MLCTVAKRSRGGVHSFYFGQSTYTYTNRYTHAFPHNSSHVRSYCTINGAYGGGVAPASEVSTAWELATSVFSPTSRLYPHPEVSDRSASCKSTVGADLFRPLVERRRVCPPRGLRTTVVQDLGCCEGGYLGRRLRLMAQGRPLERGQTVSRNVFSLLSVWRTSSCRAVLDESLLCFLGVRTVGDEPWSACCIKGVPVSSTEISEIRSGKVV